MTKTKLTAVRHGASTASQEARWALLINLEIILFRTPWWSLDRQYKLRKLIRLYRKGLTS